ncbi:MAG: TonB-dependent receptor [Hyphomonas sp.]|nr:MAG: hypothetical protein VR75_07185 [Hyphomonadaceae bacterium BRH_c29]MDP1556585.1 TonB-dependent receptor [Hyphomonas sp.]
MLRFMLFASTAMTVAATGIEPAAAQVPETAAAPAPADGAEPADDEVRLGEVVVTARRREERLSEVPTAASVIGGDALAERGGARTSGELLADQPSVRFNNLNSSVTSELSIRASSTARATNGDPSVGLYRNASYIGGGGIGGRNFALIDFLDIGRVEVLRGTQGALYGRNAVGGAVNVVSAQPEFETSGYVQAQYGIENENLRGEGVFNTALSDTLAVRFSGFAVGQESGFFYNPVNDVYFDREEGHGLRAQLRYSSGPLDLLFLAETQTLETPAIHYQIEIPAGTPGFPGGYIQDRFNYPWNTPPSAEQDVDSYQIVAKYDLGGAQLNSTTLYRERVSAYDLDADAINAQERADAIAAGSILAVVPLDVNSAAFVRDTTTSFNQDIHLTGEAIGGRLDWLAGIDLLLLESDYSVENARTPTMANPSTGNISPVNLEYNSYAVYGSLGYDLTERLNLTGELRFTQDDRSLRSRLFDRGTGAPLGGAARVIDASIDPSNLSYNATAAYKLTSDILTYAKFGTSYRAGGFNTNLGDPRQPRPIDAAFDDETSESYEVGLKGTLGSRSYFAIAAYMTNQEDLIAQTDNGCALTNPTCPVAATSFLTNAGDAESRGIEGEISSLFDVAGGKLYTGFSLSYQEGEVVSGRFDGLDLAQVPEWLGSATLNYRRPLGDDAEAFANLVYTAQTGGVQELSATTVPLDDFGLLNLRLGARFGKVSVTAFARNLTDELYFVARAPTINRYNQPRLTGVELRYDF